MFQSDTMSHRLKTRQKAEKSRPKGRSSVRAPMGSSPFHYGRLFQSVKRALFKDRGDLFVHFLYVYLPRPLQTQSRCKHQTKNKYNRCLRLARSLRAIPARVAPIQAENLRRSNCKALSCIDTYARPERARLEALILHSAALHIT